MKYYDSINNINVTVFNQVMNTSDYKKLHLKGKYDPITSYQNWVKIMNEYFNEFGIPQDYKRFIDRMFLASKKRIKAMNTNNRTFVSLAAVMEHEALTEFKQSVQGGESMNITAAKVSKFMGFVVDLDKTTVANFYSYVKLMNDGK